MISSTPRSPRGLAPLKGMTDVAVAAEVGELRAERAGDGRLGHAAASMRPVARHGITTLPRPPLRMSAGTAVR